MRKWILKAAVQKVISYLPYKEDINFVFQKYVTRGVDLTEGHFEFKLDAARDHIQYYRQYGSVPAQQAIVLELGTGWYPIVPTMLYLAGFSRVISIDIRTWMTTERSLVAFRKILAYHDSGRLAAYVPDIDLERLALTRRSPSTIFCDLAVGNGRPSIIPFSRKTDSAGPTTKKCTQLPALPSGMKNIAPEDLRSWSPSRYTMNSAGIHPGNWP